MLYYLCLIKLKQKKQMKRKNKVSYFIKIVFYLKQIYMKKYNQEKSFLRFIILIRKSYH